MSLDYLRIARGLEIEDGVNLINGVGVPGVSGDSTTVLLGSVYQRTDAGEFFVKIANGAGTDKWQRLTTKAEMDAAINGISWREPVLVKDSSAYANLAAAETAMNTGFVDGIAVINGSRVLLDNVTGSNKNVYIVTGTPGSGATFVEDPYNTVTDGDALLVQDGTYADQQWVFNGTDWVMFADNASNAEIIYIRNFIGKATTGSVMPNYTSNNFVVDGTSLMAAISALDLELGANVTSGNFILSTNKVNGNIQSLDNEIGANVTSGEVILASNTINQNLQALDSSFAQNNHLSVVTNVTTITTIDTIPVASASVCKWLVECVDATNSKRNSVEVTACLNFAGTAIDLANINILRPDTKITGLVVSVAVSGSNIVLQVTSTPSVDVKAKRLAAF